MAQNDTELCIMVLCGLPAAGKTHFTNFLFDKNDSVYDQSTEETKVNEHPTEPGRPQYIVVEYDKLLPRDVEIHLLEERANVDQHSKEILSLWKQYRSDICSCVDAFLCHLTKDLSVSISLTSIQKPSNVSRELWERFQEVMSGQMRVVGKYIKNRLCVVIDDNMYYRSMRYTYYQLARKYNMGYCQLYLSTDVNEALRRNSCRNNPVPDDVIVAMETKFEVPDTANQWERISLSSSAITNKRDMVDKLVEEALAAPVQPVSQVDEEVVNQSRQVCSASFLHQSDQILRRLVSQEMSSVKDLKLSKSEMKDFASKIQTKRKKILEDLKSAQTVVPSKVLDSIVDSSKDESSAVYEFIKNLFQFHQDIK